MQNVFPNVSRSFVGLKLPKINEKSYSNSTKKFGNGPVLHDGFHVNKKS